MRSLLRLLAVAAAAGAQAWAQCPMCRTAAAAQGEAAARAFNAGILILFVPAVGLFCGVFLFAFLRKDAEGEQKATRGRA